MNTKRKLMLGVASLGILVVLAGVALGVALAALTGNVNSGFTITYSAKNVNAAVMGTYYVSPLESGIYSEKFLEGPDEIFPNFINGITFDKNSTSDKSFKSVSLEIPAPVLELNNFVLFCYVIVNLDESDLSLNFSIEGEVDDNIEISYRVTNDTDEEIFNKRYEFLTSKDTQEKLAAIGVDSLGSLELHLNNYDGSYTGWLNNLKQDKEKAEILRELVTELNAFFTYSTTFPSNATVPPSGYTWDNIMTGITEGDYKQTNIYIKVSLKDPTVSVEDFSANFKFDLAPAV